MKKTFFLILCFNFFWGGASAFASPCSTSFSKEQQKKEQKELEQELNLLNSKKVIIEQKLLTHKLKILIQEKRNLLTQNEEYLQDLQQKIQNLKAEINKHEKELSKIKINIKELESSLLEHLINPKTAVQAKIKEKPQTDSPYHVIIDKASGLVLYIKPDNALIQEAREMDDMIVLQLNAREIEDLETTQAIDPRQIPNTIITSELLPYMAKDQIQTLSLEQIYTLVDGLKQTEKREFLSYFQILKFLKKAKDNKNFTKKLQILVSNPSPLLKDILSQIVIKNHTNLNFPLETLFSNNNLITLMPLESFPQKVIDSLKRRKILNNQMSREELASSSATIYVTPQNINPLPAKTWNDLLKNPSDLKPWTFYSVALINSNNKVMSVKRLVFHPDIVERFFDENNIQYDKAIATRLLNIIQAGYNGPATATILKLTEIKNRTRTMSKVLEVRNLGHRKSVRLVGFEHEDIIYLITFNTDTHYKTTRKQIANIHKSYRSHLEEILKLDSGRDHYMAQ